VDTFGGIDILLSNAGIGIAGPFLDSTMETYDVQMDTNVRSSYAFCLHAVPEMIKKEESQLIIMSSVTGINGHVMEVAYSATKFANRGMAQALNRGFFRRITTGRPFVTLKLAASLDGKTALANGESQWITGEAARADVHYHRLAADAIIAGTGSIIRDNARLTARYPTELPSQAPLRVIIDSRLRTPRDAAVFDDPSPILIVCGMNARAPNYPAHVEWMRLPLAGGRVPLPALLDELGTRGVNNAFVEAGASLAGAFLEQNLADEILLYLAPCLLGSGARVVQVVVVSPRDQLRQARRAAGHEQHGDIRRPWRRALERGFQDRRAARLELLDAQVQDGDLLDEPAPLLIRSRGINAELQRDEHHDDSRDEEGQVQRDPDAQGAGEQAEQSGEQRHDGRAHHDDHPPGRVALLHAGITHPEEHRDQDDQ